MRGKGQNSTVFVESEGITPAYAGKSSRIANIRAASEDNPRLCGEKAVVGNYNRIFVGSPPPMRGKGSYGYQTLSPCRDHPRLCGEKQQMCHMAGVNEGSPPPMRGKEC